MWRYVNYNGLDRYCRYLNVELYRVEEPYSTGSFATICQGRFGQFLKDRLGIQRIPYGLHMVDMIVKGALIPDLFVELPPEYFSSWRQFALMDDSEIPKELKWADYHRVPVDDYGTWSVESALHPYDSEIKSDFVDRFSANVPQNLENYTHSNGFSFRPYEAYFQYWKAYIFVEALDGYEDIGLFLSSKIGRETVISNFREKSKRWEVEYVGIFDRLSFYRTAKTILTLWQGDCYTTSGKELSEFILKASNGTTEVLEQDLEKLLILFGHWRVKEQAGRRYYLHALEQLKYDVFLLLEWLCPLTGKREEMYFEKWSRPNQGYVPLREVISFEEFELEESFCERAPDYSKLLVKAGILADVKSVYGRLAKQDSFWPWIRAFSDVHHKMVPTNTKKPLVFRQPRILDHLLVLAVRTETLICALFGEAVKSEEPKTLSEVFGGLLDKLPPKSAARTVLCEVVKNRKKTHLYERPEEIFGKIDSISGDTSEIQPHMIKSILRFATARNYFAHHFYKDRYINTGIETLPGEILSSCLDTVVYVESVVQEIASACQIPEK